ncbi:MPP7 [Branchiostoma lanceolatum]|uniref:MPP7 protein n=1 Tax=Branchiostoma lanceolatum TaxID=7740 RepID=A0A8J9Z8M8_BRALA|nr:MPP7 [Branchiostoma lanceolatum]
MPGLSTIGSDPGLQRLLQSLTHVQGKVEGQQNDFSFLNDLFQSRDFEALLKVHSLVSAHMEQDPSPVMYTAAALSLDISEELRFMMPTPENLELLRLLNSPHIRVRVLLNSPHIRVRVLLNSPHIRVRVLLNSPHIRVRVLLNSPHIRVRVLLNSPHIRVRVLLNSPHIRVRVLLNSPHIRVRVLLNSPHIRVRVLLNSPHIRVRVLLNSPHIRVRVLLNSPHIRVRLLLNSPHIRVRVLLNSPHIRVRVLLNSPHIRVRVLLNSPHIRVRLLLNSPHIRVRVLLNSPHIRVRLLLNSPHIRVRVLLNSPHIRVRVLLNSPHIRALLSSHDRVANKEFSPRLPDVESDVDFEEEEPSLKVVQLVKNEEPLGATIRLEEKTGQIFIARVMIGGAADRSGLMAVGDEIWEVNGISVRGKTPDEVVQILSNAVGTITFKLVPADLDLRPPKDSKLAPPLCPSLPPSSLPPSATTSQSSILSCIEEVDEEQVRMKAHFDYDPFEDKNIPCREAGLPFARGDVLHIVNMEDPNWWQARREGDRSCRAGLIPGRLLQERREAVRQGRPANGGVHKDRPSKSPQKSRWGSFRSSKKNAKTRKVMYQAHQNDEYDTREILTYEEVVKVLPRPGRPRPVVLIGPPGVGRNELKRRLIASDPDMYRSTVPHTTRQRKNVEIDGKDYHYVSRQVMEAEIQNSKLIEYGEYRGNLYGTHIDSVRAVVQAGRVCVLCVQPQALKLLKTSDLQPCVIYVKPPPLDRLRETRTAAGAKSTHDPSASRTFSEEELQEMIISGKIVEGLFGHYFDFVLTNDGLQQAYSDLMNICHMIQTEPQWVPAAWVR